MGKIAEVDLDQVGEHRASVAPGGGDVERTVDKSERRGAVDMVEISGRCNQALSAVAGIDLDDSAPARPEGPVIRDIEVVVGEGESLGQGQQPPRPGRHQRLRARAGIHGENASRK